MELGRWDSIGLKFLSRLAQTWQSPVLYIDLENTLTMKTITFIMGLMTSALCAQAQTYFYVSALEVIPENPTNMDEISIHVFGSFASTGSYIVSHEITVDGSIVNLEINCADPGGLTVLVPHDTFSYVEKISNILGAWHHRSKLRLTTVSENHNGAQWSASVCITAGFKLVRNLLLYSRCHIWHLICNLWPGCF